MPPLPATELERIHTAIALAARRSGVPIGLLTRVLQWESENFDSDVVYGRRKGGRGEIGIGQFMPATAREQGVDPYDPISSISGTALYLANNAKMFNKGQLPPVNDTAEALDEGWKTSEIWRKAVAAYNAGPGKVAEAISRVNPSIPGTGIPASGGIISGLANTVFGINWESGLPKSTREKYLPEIFGGSGETIGVNNAASLASEINTRLGEAGQATDTFGGPRPTLPAGTRAGRPDPNNFYRQDENGNWYLDEQALNQATQSWLTSRQMEREFDLGPLSQVVDDAIAEISQQISVGQLSLTKATTMLNNRLNAFKAGQEGLESFEYKYGSPAGAPYRPGGEPGGFYNKLGVAPQLSSGIEYDPMREALALARQGEQDLAGVQIPGIPNYSGMRESAYAQAPPPAATAPTSPTAPATPEQGTSSTYVPESTSTNDPTLLLGEALRRVRELAPFNPQYNTGAFNR